MALNHSAEFNEQEKEPRKPQPLFGFVVFLFFPFIPTLLGEIWVGLDIVNIKLPEVHDLFVHLSVIRKINKNRISSFWVPGRSFPSLSAQPNLIVFFIFLN